MKRLYKLLACALLCVTCACSNDDIPDNQETELRQEGDETVSCFNLNRTAFNLPESAADVSLRLVSPDNPEDDTAGTPKEAKTKEAKRDTLHLPTKLVMTDNKIRVEICPRSESHLQGKQAYRHRGRSPGLSRA